MTPMKVDPIDNTFQQQLLENYFELSEGPQPYFTQKLNSLSQEACANATSLLNHRIPELNSPSTQVAVATTGSDGRFEKSNPLSPIELITITANTTSLPAEVLFTLEKIAQLAQEEDSPFLNEVEPKQLQKDRAISAMFGVRKIIPTRALDARMLAGNPLLFYQYKQQLYDELKSESLAKFKREFVEDSLRTLRAELSPAPSKRPLSVQVDSGTLISDGKYRRGPKSGLLRTIQYTVALLIINAVRETDLSFDEFLQIPLSVIDRIEWLKTRNLLHLNPEECLQLQNNYLEGIRWYTHLEMQSIRQGNVCPETPTKLDISPPLLHKTLQGTHKLACKVLGKRRPAPITDSAHEPPRKRMRGRALFPSDNFISVKDESALP